MTGPAYAKGERVRLCRLEEQFFSGLDEDEIATLKSLIGRVWIVEGYAESGDIELKYARPSGGFSVRWIWVPPEWIERKK